MKTSNVSRKRSGERRESNQIVLIVCEGKETEIQYFEGFKENRNQFNLDVRKGKTQDPVDLVEDAIRFAKKEGLNLTDKDGDSAWCVFDVDDSDDARLEKAKRIADQNHINIAISNPSIEIWFLLHFQYTTGHFENSRAIIKELDKKDRIPDYQKNKNVYSIFSQDQRQQAIERSQKLNDYHVKQGRNLFKRESNPSTQIFELVSLIK